MNKTIKLSMLVLSVIMTVGFFKISKPSTKLHPAPPPENCSSLSCQAAPSVVWSSGAAPGFGYPLQSDITSLTWTNISNGHYGIWEGWPFWMEVESGSIITLIMNDTSCNYAFTDNILVGGWLTYDNGSGPWQVHWQQSHTPPPAARNMFRSWYVEYNCYGSLTVIDLGGNFWDCTQ